MKYDERFVIFIDILGFREKVAQTLTKDGKEQPDAIKNINDALKISPDTFNSPEIDSERYDLKRVTQFSDSVIVSFILKNPGDILFALEDSLILILRLIWRGFPCRGGITYGKLIHTESLLFGPAMIEAYDLESQAAFYPRIIVSEGVLVKAFEFYKSKPEITDYDLHYDFGLIKELVTKDLDGLYFVDYFTKVNNVIDKENFIEYYRRLEQLIRNGLSSNQEHILVKYSWMKEKYNIFVKNAQRVDILESLEQEKQKELLEFCKKLKEL